MNVVHVYGGTLSSSRVKRIGGIEEHFLNLSSKLNKNLYVLYAGKPYDDSFSKLLEDNLSTFVVLGDTNYFKYLFEFIKFIRKIKEDDSDLIVHVHFGPISHMIIMICRLMGISNIYWTKHSRMATHKYSKPWFKSKLTKSLVKKIICVSSSVEEELKALSLDFHKTYVLPLGLNVEKYQGSIPEERMNLFRKELKIDDNTFVITIVAQQRPEKRVEVFIKAFAEFLKKNNKANIVALIVGGGPLEEENKQLADSYNISDHIRFMGLRHDIDVIYAISSVAGLTSETEGFGLAIAEAAAKSLPLFGSKAGAMPELIKDGKTGFLFEVGDYQKLSEIFTRYYQDESLCSKFGQAALTDMMERYDINICSDNLIQLYNSEFGDE